MDEWSKDSLSGILPRMPETLHGFEHINRYWDRTRGRFAAKILPGEYYVTKEDELVVTVLGSCISACIRDKTLGVGGMNHFMLPVDTRVSKSPMDAASGAARYGNFAMEHLINDILKIGGTKENLEVKIVGGGRIITNMSNIGLQNIRFIREYIQTEGLTVVGEHVGGDHPRKVVYHPRTGKANVKQLISVRNATIYDRERRYMRDLKEEPVGGEVELF